MFKQELWPLLDTPLKVLAMFLPMKMEKNSVYSQETLYFWEKLGDQT